MNAQLSSGYEPSAGFRDAFFRIMGAAPSLLGQGKVLKASWLDTPLGPMITISDEEVLYLLEFVDRRGLEREVKCLRQKTKSAIIPGSTKPICSIEKEINLYFEGKLKKFSTPLYWLGSPFQKRVWEELKKISYGETRSYADIAKAIGNHAAFRAVARANGANQIAIVIPCHRVINSNRDLGGYSGGLARKIGLINHEKRYKNEANESNMTSFSFNLT